MIQAALLALLMASKPAPPPVTIYVGPRVRDGFADMDEGVRDSIKDVKNALKVKLRPEKKNAPFHLVDDATTADVKLYVLARTVASSSDSTTGGTVAGTTAIVGSSKKGVHRLDTLLSAGAYERSFASGGDGGWDSLAEGIAKDVAAWLAENRERIVNKH